MIAASQSQSQTQDAKNSVRIPRITRLWFAKETNTREKLVKIVSAKLDSFVSAKLDSGLEICGNFAARARLELEQI